MQKESPPRLRRFGHSHAWLALSLVLLMLMQISPPTTAQPVAPEVDPENNKSVATIMGIVALMFLVSGFLSLYSGKCTERQGVRLDLTFPNAADRRQQNEPCVGLNQEVIDTFPTFLYSNVKGLKIGKGTLACAVCLNEFEDDETLRMIPKCSHVYHPNCIDSWLASHITCPLCRANLIPRPDDTTTTLPPTTVSIQMPEDHELQLHHPNEQTPEQEEDDAIRDNTVQDHKREDDVESPPKFDFLRRCRTMNFHNRAPTRSRSTGFLSSLWFSRSNSMADHHPPSVLVQHGENCERFTLRLPDEVRSQMLKRANSCVSFARMSSGTWGYRTRSVGSGGHARGGSCVQYERFGSHEEQWGFSLTPPSFVRNGWNRSSRKNSDHLGVALDNNAGERSSDHLCPG